MVKRCRNQSLCQLFLVLAGICIMTGCKSKNEKIQTSDTSSAVTEISVPVDSLSPETTAADLVTETDTAAENENNDTNSPTKMNTYISGNISIQYPSVLNIKDQAKADAVDSLIKENALSVIKAYQADGSIDTMVISCKVLAANSNRIILTYSGYVQMNKAAEPVKLFYSNTIDINEVKNIGFDRYADPYTMAGYVMSDDCRFLEKTEQQAAELRSWLHKEGTIESYTTMFKQADFPFDSDFPSSFSYEYDGGICFSVPVSHNLGDYAIVIYTPDTK